MKDRSRLTIYDIDQGKIDIDRLIAVRKTSILTSTQVGGLWSLLCNISRPAMQYVAAVEQGGENN